MKVVYSFLLLEVVPGFFVVFIVTHKIGIVVGSFADSENILAAFAPLEAVWKLKEGNVLLVGALVYALLITSKGLNSVLLD